MQQPIATAETQPVKQEVVEPKAEIVEKKEEIKPQEEKKPIVHSLNEDLGFDFTPAEPVFQPVKEPATEPVAPAPAKVFNGEESKSTVKHFDNPFLEDNDNDGFEITSRVITHEELETKHAVKMDVITLEEPKKAVDPKDELRKQRMRALSMNFRTPKGLEELENQPAYMRRNIDISTNAGNDLSHYASSKNGLSSENSFLHDNVD